MQRYKLFFWVFFIISSHLLYSKENKHEISLTPGAVYMADKADFAPGLQLEYEYHINSGIGDFNLFAALENVFTNDSHYGISVGVSFKLIGNLEIFTGPGLVMHGNELMFSAVIGTGYGFDIGRIVIGPVFEFAYIGHHSHAMLGMAVGVGF